jgi:hypothetical protein
VGKLDWQKGIEQDDYQVSFPLYSVSIQQEGRDPRDRTYILKLRNEDGEVIEEVSPDSLPKTNSLSRSQSVAVYGAFEKLFLMARSKALGVDDAVSSLLTSLEKLAPGLPESSITDDTDDDVPF